FYYHSQPGDFIGDGERGALHAGTGWTLPPRRNYHNGVSFDAGGNGAWWKIELAAAGDSGAPPLAVGSYENAVRFPLENGTSPGLSVSNVLACNTLRGRFDVLEVAYAADGSVQRFATVWVGAASATFQATTAIAVGTNVLYLRSTPGDYIGEGKTRTLHAANGFTFTPTRNFYNGMFFSIQGAADSWNVNLAAAGNPPTSAPPLAPRAYENAMYSPPQAGRPVPGVDRGNRACQ